MTHPLDGARLRVDRAREHLSELDAEINGFLETKPYVIDTKTDLKNGKHVLRAIFKPTAQPPPRIGLLVGDAVHSLRAALDYIIYEVTRTLPRRQRPREPSYPLIETNAMDYRTNALPLFAHLPGPKRAFIRKLQPYRCGYPTERHPLVRLHAIWNRDKHRVLETSFAQVSTETSRIWGSSISALYSIKQYTGPVQNQAQLLKIVFTTDSGSDVNVEFHLAIDISLRDGLPIRDFIDDTATLVDLHIDVLDPVFPGSHDASPS